MNWIEEQENRYANQVKSEAEMLFEMTSRHAIRPMDHTVKYYAGTDPFEPKLNWLQRQLQKIGLYKQGVTKVTVCKVHTDGTIEQLK